MFTNKPMTSIRPARIVTNLKRLLKIGISLGLLAWIISRIPPVTIKKGLLQCQWPCLLLAFFMVNLCMVISVLKWNPLLKVHQITISFNKLIGFYYAGLFANNFLPSSIGGDALRIYDVAKESNKTKEAAASVIMERLIASLALGLTAAVAMALMSSQKNNHLVTLSVSGLVVLCLLLLIFLFWYPFNEESKVGRWLYQLSTYKKHPAILTKVLLFSFIFQICLVFANIFTFQSLGIYLPVATHFLYIPVIMAVSMLPLSINGLGVREGMYVLLYGYSGIEPAAAVLCSLLFFTQVTITSLAGGLIILLRR